MANEFHIRVIKLAKYEELRPAAYGVFIWPIELDAMKETVFLKLLLSLAHASTTFKI